MTVTVSGNINAALAGVRTVSLHPKARVLGPAAGRSSRRLQADIERAIVMEFRGHGYEIAPVGAGDVEIAYGVGLSGVLADRELFDIFGVAPGLESDNEESRGAIVLALYKPRLKTVTWRAGVSSPAAAEGYDDAERYERITNSVRQLLDGMRDRP